jgi:REP element-mobilizing transposase RayT
LLRPAGIKGVRLTLIFRIGVPQQIIQRGNNHQVCFASEQDFAAYITWLKTYAAKFKIEIHAWVLMTNHVHLLCTPRAASRVINGRANDGKKKRGRRLGWSKHKE